ncbi:hypothetical protein lerEdw1_009919 [Lerista edwardsae]|nr:hypothetical protein lerEdw1_009919 [Lerista edwardsae]
MAEELASSVFFQHQYMCSECGLLYNTLEEVLIHQQSHLGEPCEAPAAATVVDTGPQQDNRYQCLECGCVLWSPDELLAHQEVHPREVPARPQPSPATTGQIRYQCNECNELFPSTSLWLAHRQTHQKQEASGDSQPPSQPALLQTPQPPSSVSAEASLPLPSQPVQPMYPYECSECACLFLTPEELLEHQGEHFTEIEKESGEPPEVAVQDFCSPHVSPPPCPEEPLVAPPLAEALCCSECKQTFGTVEALRWHQQEHTASSEEFLCTAGQPTQTIMCTEFGETIAIIESTEPLPLVETIEIYQATLEGNIQVNAFV